MKDKSNNRRAVDTRRNCLPEIDIAEPFLVAGEVSCVLRNSGVQIEQQKVVVEAGT